MRLRVYPYSSSLEVRHVIIDALLTQRVGTAVWVSGDRVGGAISIPFVDYHGREQGAVYRHHQIVFQRPSKVGLREKYDVNFF